MEKKEAITILKMLPTSSQKEQEAIMLAVDSLKSHSRTFNVSTPLGTLKATAKADFGHAPTEELEPKDSMADYPGIYIDFVREGQEDIMLACVEYDSSNDVIKTCVYGDGYDDSPTDIITHEGIIDDNEEKE